MPLFTKFCKEGGALHVNLVKNCGNCGYDPPTTARLTERATTAAPAVAAPAVAAAPVESTAKKAARSFPNAGSRNLLINYAQQAAAAALATERASSDPPTPSANAKGSKPQAEIPALPTYTEASDPYEWTGQGVVNEMNTDLALLSERERRGYLLDYLLKESIHARNRVRRNDYYDCFLTIRYNDNDQPVRPGDKSTRSADILRMLKPFITKTTVKLVKASVYVTLLINTDRSYNFRGGYIKDEEAELARTSASGFLYPKGHRVLKDSTVLKPNSDVQRVSATAAAAGIKRGNNMTQQTADEFIKKLATAANASADLAADLAAGAAARASKSNGKVNQTMQWMDKQLSDLPDLDGGDKDLASDLHDAATAQPLEPRLRVTAAVAHKRAASSELLPPSLPVRHDNSLIVLDDDVNGDSSSHHMLAVAKATALNRAVIRAREKQATKAASPLPDTQLAQTVRSSTFFGAANMTATVPLSTVKKPTSSSRIPLASAPTLTPLQERSEITPVKLEPVKPEPEFGTVKTEPAIKEPAIKELVIEEPVIKEPVIEEPVIKELVIKEPVINKLRRSSRRRAASKKAAASKGK
ncbi:unnamed protein product [Zymoseptoria tritici ST99CH_1A5]|uniref:Uncharacterized protein n=1 Tax=Zymoseptoria tritici ST99CH_1A5 TaxID=1276529 RepID=A0A1Y6LTJ9_ZYMTR|nr:unnamed protein product [Zymoseptoria tritici ST99CH_1A5]